MDEQDFKILKTINETRNITHAADKLYISQSSLSKKIIALEKELDTEILIRKRQGVSFTPEGEIILKKSTEAANILEDMRRELVAQKGYVSGTLNIGVSVNYARYSLPSVLAKYSEKYPKVRIHVTTEQSRNIYLKALNGEIDIAIIRGEFDWRGEKILLSREKVCAIRNENFNIDDLNSIAFIGRKTDMEFEREMSQWMREKNINPSNDGIFVDNITTCVEMVERGLGWSIVPEICLDNFKGIVKPLYFENGEPLERSTYIMYYKDVCDLPQVNAFIEMLKNEEDL